MNSLFSRIILYVFIALCAVLPFAIASGAPSNFPVKQIITIPKGEGLSGLADLLKSDGMIRLTFIFKVALFLTRNQHNIKAGDYSFDRPLSALDLGRKIVAGDHGLALVKITFPEGTSLTEIPPIVGTQLSLFSKTDFLTLTKGKEGYLFPDTYLFLEDEKAKDLIGVMEENFNNKIATIQDQITAFDKPLPQVVIMASLLEKEARTTETRRIIAGILWKRLQLGMPLQVDASVSYVTGKSTFDLSLTDLNNPSAYNTYRYKGLPIGPITNPGLDSLLAAVTPISTPYLYYLSDKNGVMHYAATFADHLKNKALYLNN